MAKSPEFIPAGSGYGLPQVINENFTRVKEALENTLSRDGSTPNGMNADLDMNSNDILNARSISTEDLTVDGKNILELIDDSEAILEDIQELLEETIEAADRAEVAAEALENVLYLQEDTFLLEDGVSWYPVIPGAKIQSIVVNLNGVTLTKEVDYTVETIDGVDGIRFLEPVGFSPLERRCTYQINRIAVDEDLANIIAASAIVTEAPSSFADFYKFEVYSDGKALWFNGVGFIRDRSANIPDFPAGPGWKPYGEATPEHFGTTADEDAAAALQAWLNYSATGPAAVLEGSSYTFGSSLSFPDGAKIRGHLRITTTAATGISISAGADVEIEDLTYHVKGGSASSNTFTTSTGFKARNIHLEVDTQSNGTFWTARNLGLHVERITTKNWTRPFSLTCPSDVHDLGGYIGTLSVDTFIRAFATVRASGFYIENLIAKGKADGAAKDPGHNGLLIQGSSDWRIDNIWVEGAGEHSFRIGGSFVGYPTERWSIGSMTSVNPGGCHFKINDGDNQVVNGYVGVLEAFANHLISIGRNCETIRVTNSDKISFGTVRAMSTEAGTYSCSSGVQINGSTNISVGFADLKNCKNDAIRIDDALDANYGATNNINIGWVCSDGSPSNILEVNHTSADVGNIVIGGGFFSAGYTQLIKTSGTTTATWTGPIYFSGVTGGAFSFDLASGNLPAIVMDLTNSEGRKKTGLFNTTNLRGSVMFEVGSHDRANVTNWGGITLSSPNRTSEVGAAGAGIDFIRPASSRRGGAIAIVQTGSDSWNTGFSFQTSNSNATEAIVERAIIDNTGLHSSVKVGYKKSSSVGGTVTQATNKSTAVTLNLLTGRINTAAESLIAGLSATFKVNNSRVAADDVVVVNVASPTQKYSASVVGVESGAFYVQLTNITYLDLAEAVQISFAIIQASSN